MYSIINGLLISPNPDYKWNNHVICPFVNTIYDVINKYYWGNIFYYVQPNTFVCIYKKCLQKKKKKKKETNKKNKSHLLDWEINFYLVKELYGKILFWLKYVDLIIVYISSVITVSYTM